MKALDLQEDLTIGNIKKEMLEKRPLPIGLTQLMEWTDRIIAGAGIDGSEACGWVGDNNQLRWMLCEFIQHYTSPTEDFKEDAFFIKRLRHQLSKETAFGYMQKLKREQEQKLAADTAPKLGVVDGGILENKKI